VFGWQITADGVFIEKLETDVSKYLPEVNDSHVSENVTKININMPMDELRKKLSTLPVTTRLSLTGAYSNLSVVVSIVSMFDAILALLPPTG
jgi:Tfp pilus assembly protein PilO